MRDVSTIGEMMRKTTHVSTLIAITTFGLLPSRLATHNHMVWMSDSIVALQIELVKLIDAGLVARSVKMTSQKRTDGNEIDLTWVSQKHIDRCPCTFRDPERARPVVR